MMHLSQTLATVLIICVTIIHIFAICLTFFRLYHRHSISRLWWDDYLAAVAGIVDCGAIIDLWLGYMSSNHTLRSLEAQMVRYEIGFLSIVAVQWATRIALALAFARIFPPGEVTRRYAILLAILFLCFFITIIIQAVFFCSNISAWIFTALMQCNFRGEILIYLVVANIFSDCLLVCSPLYALRRLRLPDEQKRLIFACFTGSVFMSLACIATTILQFAPMTWEPARGEIRVVLGYLEGSVSLIVCNLLVIVTYLYKVIRQERPRVTETPADHSHPQDMHETDRTTRSNPSHTEEYGTTFSLNLTEISGAYFTDPIPTSTSHGTGTVR